MSEELTESKLIRIAVFGSFYRGYYLLDELLFGPHNKFFKVVGVATDDVDEKFIAREKRVWQYEHRKEEEVMVEQYAQRNGIPVYKGRVKSDVFYEMHERSWIPDICISGTFGQRLDERVFSFPKYGFFNTHPCIGDVWPSKYAGPNPFQALMDDGMEYTTVALHRVDAGFDSGELVAMSSRIAMPPGVSVVDMHKICAPVVARFVVPELLKVAGVLV